MAATYSSLVGLAVGGKYEIRRVLGIGGMGVVCEAVNTDLQKRVALKLIDKSMKESELIVERFRREARAAGQIRSEHIVDVFDMGADARVGLYMVMEHLVGEDLQTRLERDKRLDVNTSVMIGHQIARGLSKAHAAGVIHRDLKPANVFLTARDNGQLLVKLLDFGVSKLLADDGSARITGSGAPIGTPLYMSPEQAEGKADVDGRADIWSLGALLYEALSGEPPFADRGSYHGTIVGILTSRPRLLKTVAPWVPTEICAVVDAMLVHDRDARIRTAETVTKRLLEAYPAVLPDGTGRHTAVIVSQAAAAIDATGDTEIFTSPGMRISGENGSRPPSGGGGAAGSRPPRGSIPDASSPAAGVRAPSQNPPQAADSHKTVPEPPKDDGVSSAATTRAATDVRASDPNEDEAAPMAQRPQSGISARPRTEPLPNATPSSASGGVSMPATPPIIEPLPRAPDTVRDLELANRAERRRYMAFAAILGTLIAFSFAGFYIGRHASERDGARAPVVEGVPAKAAPGASGAAAGTATAVGTATAAGTVPPSVKPGDLPSAAVRATEAPSASAGAPTGTGEATPRVAPKRGGGRKLVKPAGSGASGGADVSGAAGASGSAGTPEAPATEAPAPPQAPPEPPTGEAPSP